MVVPSYDAAPPIAAPLRFFLSMPLFGVLLALALVLVEPVSLGSRWHGQVLAMTHLLTLGMLGQPMLGALIQMLPVVAGVGLPWPVWLARWTHGLLLPGILALCAGFWGSSLIFLQVAAVLLPLSLLPFLLSGLLGLIRYGSKDATSRMILLALSALMLVVVMGAGLLSHLGWGVMLDAVRLTNLHALWGGLGWILALVAGVAYTVVPMFQMTPRYPSWMERSALPLMLVLLVLVSCWWWCGWPGARWVPMTLLAGMAAAFSLITVWLQRQSRRASDVTLQFWRAGMLCLALASGLALPVWQGIWPRAGLLAGAVFLLGFGVSVVNGMLYKIVPFLVWLHLQRINRHRFAIPNMKQIMAEAPMLRQWRWHLVSLSLLVPALAWPERLLLVPAGLALAVSQGLLGFNLLQAARLYQSTARRIHSAEAGSLVPRD